MSSTEGTLILTLGTLVLYIASLLFKRPPAFLPAIIVKVVSSIVWAGVAFAGVSSWWGLPPDTSKLHLWDLYHYYVGTKYFEELRYTGLYNCSLRAELELKERAPTDTPGVTTGGGEPTGAEDKPRAVRDLASNTFASQEESIARSDGCFSRFSSNRWQAFTYDISWFKSRMGERWKTVFHDHGYNPSPWWVFVATLALPEGPVSEPVLRRIVALDIALIAIMWGVLLITFEPKVVAVAAVFWGTNPLANGTWTAGGYLRHDWILAAVCAVALLSRVRLSAQATQSRAAILPLVGAGILLGYAISVRIFPVVLILGLLCARAPSQRWLRGICQKPIRLIALGAIVTGAVCVSISAAQFGGSVWSEFRDNTRKHVGSRSGNLVGVSHVVDHYVQCQIVGTSESGVCNPPELLSESPLGWVGKIIGLICAAAFFTWLIWIAPSLTLSEITVAASLALPLLTSPSSYYLEILMLATLMCGAFPAVGVVVLSLVAVLQLIASAVTPPNKIYLVASVMLVQAVVLIVALVRKRERSDTPALRESTPPASPSADRV